MGKQPFIGVSGLLPHERRRIIFINSQGQRRQGVCDQVHPKDMTCLQGRLQGKQDCHKHSDDLAKVGGQKEQNGFLDVHVNASALFHGLLNGGKVVICQHHIRRIFCHIRAVSAHSNPDVSGLQGRRVVDTVSGHGYNLSVFPETADNLHPMGRGHAGKYPQVFHFFSKALLAHIVQLRAGDALVHGVRDTDFFGNCQSCVFVIPSDHRHLYPCLFQSADGLGDFFSGRVHHAGHSSEHQAACEG